MLGRIGRMERVGSITSLQCVTVRRLEVGALNDESLGLKISLMAIDASRGEATL